MKKLLIGLLILGLVVGAAFAAITVFYKPGNLTQAERDKALTKMLGRKVELSPTTASTAWVKHTGKYLSLLRPQAATEYTADKAEIAKNTTILEKIDFGQTHPRLTIVVLVTNANGATKVDDASGVGLRKNQPKEYTQKPVKIGPYNGLRFVKKDGTEDTSFLYANGRFYSFAVSGGQGVDLEDTTNRLLESVELIK
jgi:hypothetical protein